MVMRARTAECQPCLGRPIVRHRGVAVIGSLLQPPRTVEVEGVGERLVGHEMDMSDVAEPRLGDVDDRCVASSLTA